MDIVTRRVLVVAAFALQTLLVFAGNSRLFGLLQPGSGWYTNSEMSTRYSSLVQPAKWAFAIWGIIYTWEIATMLYLVLASPPTLVFWRGTAPTVLWVAANAFQGMWALLFATERISLATISLAGIAISLVSLGFTLRSSSGLEYGLVAAPLWLHAGWASAAAIVNVNMWLGLFASTATQLAAANASAFIACAIGLGVIYSTAVDTSSSSPLVAAPLVAALCWALLAIRGELREPFLIANNLAYKEIGEVARTALQLVVVGCAAALGLGSVVIMSARLAGAGQWTVMV